VLIDQIGEIITAINAQGTPVVLLEQNAGRAAPRRCLPVMAMAAEVSRMAEECMRFAAESDVATRPTSSTTANSATRSAMRSQWSSPI